MEVLSCEITKQNRQQQHPLLTSHKHTHHTLKETRLHNCARILNWHPFCNQSSLVIRFLAFIGNNHLCSWLQRTRSVYNTTTMYLLNHPLPLLSNERTCTLCTCTLEILEISLRERFKVHVAASIVRHARSESSWSLLGRWSNACGFTSQPNSGLPQILIFIIINFFKYLFYWHNNNNASKFSQDNCLSLISIMLYCFSIITFTLLHEFLFTLWDWYQWLLIHNN